ncbi:arylsulfatase [Ilumatobacter nonamiensis]|uniref:arylsulfatase n=1 Tax=Ilumatobacter nonamiensis TaxID=467093 RepID=UPI0003460A7D|nr:arylsulfatase [Ilumatobacter nonamiensis]
MSDSGQGQRFEGTIGTTIADSTPWWPDSESDGPRRRNVLLVLLDDVGYADFGCYGSAIATPAIDRLAAEGIRSTGFHTTAMCSTTRAALLTGRNHHAVGMGCLANFDSGFPGYRGKISADTPTLPEMLAPHGYRNYMVGKWHATRTTETGPTGPFDGWPLGRGFDRFYGFLDAETDQYSPELVRDNTHVTAPGDHSTGYHLSADLADEVIRNLTDHHASTPDAPWYLQFAPGACHAPHQAPRELIDHYTTQFEHGWDVERERRLARQIELGIVPAGTELPPRNLGVKAWDEHTADEHRLFSRLAGAYAAMLDHFDQQLQRVIDALERTGQLDDTIVLVLSDNGASQEGGPLGFVNAMAPFNMVPEPLDEKLARLDDIGGPDTHSNFPHGWAMAANTPLRMYKQNTHGGGIRDPLVIRTPDTAVHARGELRHDFCHASDLAPTILDLLGLDASEIDDVTGVSFADTLTAGASPTATRKSTQYFEMFGHRGIWHEGWKAVAWHPAGSSFDDDRWELFDLTTDFNECHDLADSEPERLAELIELWWSEARANQVLPLDDRFGERFAENAERFHGDRRRYVFTAGMGHLPSDVAPDLRSRSYTVTARIHPYAAGNEGVLISHGDATCGYSLFVRDGRLVHDLNIGGSHQLVESDVPIDDGATELGFRMQRRPGDGPFPHGVGTLTVDGVEVGRMETDQIFWLMISWSGLDIGLDRGTTVADYDRTGRHVGPFTFTGSLIDVTVDLDNDQDVDHEAAGAAELGRE